jgi:hypothetical protein
MNFFPPTFPSRATVRKAKKRDSIPLSSNPKTHLIATSDTLNGAPFKDPLFPALSIQIHGHFLASFCKAGASGSYPRNCVYSYASTMPANVAQRRERYSKL